MTNLHYWDSCAFLAWLQNESAHEAACRDTIEQAKSGEIVLVTSALTIAEVLWTKNGPRLEEDKATILNKFFRRSYIRIGDCIFDKPGLERAMKSAWIKTRFNVTHFRRKLMGANYASLWEA